MYLETERLIIRDLSQQDIDDLYEMQNDLEVTKYLSYDNWSYERCQNNLDEWIEQYRDDNGVKVYAIEEDNTSHMIGIIGFINYENEVEIVIRMKSSRWRKGYGSEVMMSMISYIFENDISKIIVGITHQENIRMQSLFAKLGFKDVTGMNKENGVKYSLQKGC